MWPAPLPFGLTADALAAAMAESDPDSLAAATRLRGRFGAGPRRGCAAPGGAAPPGPAKFGGGRGRGCSSPGPGWSRPPGPRWPITTPPGCVAAGARRVIDLGCGIGSDALAFARAGLGGDRGRHRSGTAAVARANLADRGDGGLRRRRGRWPRTWLRPATRAVRRPGAGATSAAGCGGSRTSRRAGRCSAACWTEAGRPGSSSARRCRTSLIPADRRGRVAQRPR